jgi:predicted O-methyltransferase YrrM
MTLPTDDAELRHPAAKLAEALFGGNPYDGFTPASPEPDLQGWNGNHPTLTRLVEQYKPGIIIDVGVWKGQSTITFARAQEKVAPDGFVIAVDTFLGSPEHWTLARPDVHRSLAFRHGRPSFYETFLSNVVLAKATEQIVPLAQTSENAAAILRRHGIMPDLVHIDAAHEYHPVLRDIEVWWAMLKQGGVLVGDDFVSPGVAKAVVHFSDKLGLPFQVNHPKWWIVKPV